MKATHSIVSVLLLGLWTVLGNASAAPASSDQLATLLERAPLTTLDGAAATVTADRGEVTVVHFWASWCAPCKKELPLLQELAESLESRPVEFALISIDTSRRKAQRFVSRHQLDLPFYHEGPDGLAASLEIPYLPCSYVIDGSGKTVFATTGSGEEQVAKLRAKLFELTEPDRAAK